MMRIFGYWYRNGKQSAFIKHERIIPKAEEDDYKKHLLEQHDANEIYLNYQPF